MRSMFRLLSMCSLVVAAACGTTTSSTSTDATTTEDAGADAGGDAASSDATGADAAGDTVGQGVALHGVWSTNFGGYSEISEQKWDDATVHTWNLDGRWAVTQNPANDQYNPSKFNRMVWTAPVGDSVYVCTVAYGLGTAQLALDSTATADATAPDASGCGGFAWTKLTKTDPIAVAGSYTDGFGGKSTITSRFWDVGWIAKFDNTMRFAITQSPADDKYTPSKFTKLVWTAPVGGTFYTCMVDYGLDSAALAEATTKTADDAAPDKSGCGGFSWTKMTPQ